MEYRKERNLICAYNENNELRGKVDLLTNEFYGVHGTKIKSKPACFTYDLIAEAVQDAVTTGLMLFLKNNNKSNFYSAPQDIARCQRLEQIISVGLKLHVDSSTWYYLCTGTERLTKDAVQYLKDNNNGYYDRDMLKAYAVTASFKDFLEKIDEEDRQYARTVLARVNQELLPREFLQQMIYYGIHEKIQIHTNTYEFSNLIHDWYNKCTEMEQKVEAKRNVKTSYDMLCWEYKQFKNKKLDEDLKKNDVPFLHFETDEYIVVPLCSRKDFHDEAQAQHNCVESMYMERVANGRTHVVGVRKKNNPTVPFITCEVAKDGTIVQFLYACNRSPANGDPVWSFYYAYRDHLKEAK